MPVAVESAGKQPAVHPELMFLYDGGEVLLGDLLIPIPGDIVIEDRACKEGRLASVLQKVGVGNVSQPFDKQLHIVQIVPNLRKFAAREQGEIGKIGIPIVKIRKISVPARHGKRL